MSQNPIHARGRGSTIKPQSRFESTSIEADMEYLNYDADAVASLRKVKTEYFPDDSQSIVSENKSPDIPFRYSVNPYRGCAHGCSYCYARPTHEYLGFNAGLDFESKILVKHNAARLLRKWLARPCWNPEPIAFSGVTDCYQPAESQYELTRQCLQVCCDANQPVIIITKNSLIARDVDILSQMAARQTIHVAMSITSLDQSLTREMEPRTSSPQSKLNTIRLLSDAGIPVKVMVAPVVPGLNESEIPAILKACAEHGATDASYVMLRLPWTVKDVFEDWLQRVVPAKKEKVLAFVRATRGGELNSTKFNERLQGTGWIADQVQQTMRVFKAKFGMNSENHRLNCDAFVAPFSDDGQMRLF